MPCNLTKEQMAKAGYSAEDIALMEKEVELARMQANVEAADRGLTQRQQRDLELQAMTQARKRFDQKMHAKLDKMMADIKALGDAKKLPVH